MAPVASELKYENPTMGRHNLFHPSGPSQLTPTSSTTSAPHRPSSEQRQPFNHQLASLPTSSQLPDEEIEDLLWEQAASSHSGARSEVDRADRCEENNQRFSQLCRRLKELTLYTRSSRLPPTSSSPTSISTSSQSSSASTPAFLRSTIIHSLPSHIPRNLSHPLTVPIFILHNTTLVLPPITAPLSSAPPCEHYLTGSTSQLHQSTSNLACWLCLDIFRRGLEILTVPNNQPAEDLNSRAWIIKFLRSSFRSSGDWSRTISSFHSRNHKDKEVRISLQPEMAGVKGTPSARRKQDESSENSTRQQSDGFRDAEMMDSPMMMTPAQAVIPSPHTAANSRPYARPVTRSMTKVNSGDPLDSTSCTTTSTSLKDRLRKSSNKKGPTLHTSNLENSRDIQYGEELDDMEPEEYEGDADSEMKDQEQDQEEDRSLISPRPRQPPRIHPEIGQLRVSSRRSTRINDHKIAVEGLIDPPTEAPAKKRARKADRIEIGPVRSVRRSPRFWKPLTEFHQYTQLPNELKMMIWEAAIEPRLVYICNRSSYLHAQSFGAAPFGVQNKSPTWFSASRLSVWIAHQHYQKRFALYSPITRSFDHTTIQDFNPNIDIVIFEPCHGACRGCHCARHQYCDADRSAVRFLAIQTESPTLPVTSEPCWQTVTRSWPNVETLYLMRFAVRGIDRSDKAMIRVKTNEHEVSLLKKFEQWKKGPGASLKVNKLEFVVVVAKESATVDPKERYQSVNDRLTGLPEDVILD